MATATAYGSCCHFLMPYAVGIYAIIVINDLICILKFGHICCRSYAKTLAVTNKATSNASVIKGFIISLSQATRAWLFLLMLYKIVVVKDVSTTGAKFRWISRIRGCPTALRTFI